MVIAPLVDQKTVLIVPWQSLTLYWPALLNIIGNICKGLVSTTVENALFLQRNWDLL